VETTKRQSTGAATWLKCREEKKLLCDHAGRIGAIETRNRKNRPVRQLPPWYPWYPWTTSNTVKRGFGHVNADGAGPTGTPSQIVRHAIHLFSALIIIFVQLFFYRPDSRRITFLFVRKLSSFSFCYSVHRRTCTTTNSTNIRVLSNISLTKINRFETTKNWNFYDLHSRPTNNIINIVQHAFRFRTART